MIVNLTITSKPWIKYKDLRGYYPRKVISYIMAQKLIDIGFLSYLAFI